MKIKAVRHQPAPTKSQSIPRSPQTTHFHRIQAPKPYSNTVISPLLLGLGEMSVATRVLWDLFSMIRGLDCPWVGSSDWISPNSLSLQSVSINWLRIEREIESQNSTRIAEISPLLIGLGEMSVATRVSMDLFSMMRGLDCPRMASSDWISPNSRIN